MRTDMIARLLTPLLLVIVGSIQADSWVFPNKLETERFEFGDLVVERIVDSRINNQYPRFEIVISNKNETLGRFRGLHFIDHAVSNDNRYFLGLSNSGVAQFAIVLFDSEANLLLARKHNARDFQYCEESVTVVREWYDGDDPEVQFEMSGEYLEEIGIRGCDGSRLRIIEMLFGA